MPSVLRLTALASGAVLSLVVTSVHGQQSVLTLADWTATVPIEGPRTSHAAFVSGNRLYVLGGLFVTGNVPTLLDDVQVAELGNDGSVLGSGWRDAGRIPVARSGHGLIAFDGRVYLVGGYSATGTLGDTNVAAIREDGKLGPWVPSPNRLNIPRSNLSLQMWKAPSGQAHLLAIGGVNQVGSDTVHFDEVEVATVSGDGSVGPWRVCPFHMKGGRSAPGTAVQGDVLIVLGGWGDLLDDLFGDIQTSTLGEDGCPGPWATSPRPLPLPVYGHSVVVMGATGLLTAFVLGGNAGQGNYLNAVQTVSLGKDGRPGGVGLDSHLFATARWGHATVRYNEYVYVIGGARRGEGGFLSDVQYTRVPLP